MVAVSGCASVFRLHRGNNNWRRERNVTRRGRGRSRGGVSRIRSGRPEQEGGEA